MPQAQADDSRELARIIYNVVETSTQHLADKYGFPRESDEEKKNRRKGEIAAKRKEEVLHDRKVSVAEACIEAAIKIAMRDEHKEITKDEFISIAFSCYNRSASGNIYSVNKEEFGLYLKSFTNMDWWLPVEGTEEEKGTFLARNISNLMVGLLMQVSDPVLEEKSIEKKEG